LIPAETPAVFADFHQIQQVILNLIINAIDAMEEGGELVIQTGPSRGTALRSPAAGADPDRRFVEITVTDSGVGIPEENLEVIFDPFYTTKAQGTGLGLSIVYRIIAAHNGEISVSSKLGEGTTFRVILPTEEESK